MPGFLFFQYFDFDEPGFNGAIRAPCSLASSAIFLPSLKSFTKGGLVLLSMAVPVFPFGQGLSSLNPVPRYVGNTWNSGTAGSRYKEDFSYDGNGNIDTLKRANQNGVAMDFLRYQYERDLITGRLKTNRLRQVLDDVAGSTGDFDLAAGQIDGNYRYDLIGNMIGDNQSRINNIDWSVYGKIRQITKSDNDNIAYSYDPSGNRVSKTTNTLNTYYVRDAQGNNLAVYDNEGGTLHWQEQSLYGSSRLGMWRPNLNLADGNASADWGYLWQKVL